MSQSLPALYRQARPWICLSQFWTCYKDDIDVPLHWHWVSLTDTNGTHKAEAMESCVAAQDWRLLVSCLQEGEAHVWISYHQEWEICKGPTQVRATFSRPRESNQGHASQPGSSKVFSHLSWPLPCFLGAPSHASSKGIVWSPLSLPLICYYSSLLAICLGFL